MDRRILELAVEALENRKAGIDAEIEETRARLTGSGRDCRSGRRMSQIHVRSPGEGPERTDEGVLGSEKELAAKREHRAF